MTTDSLLPCPFCGGEGLVHRVSGSGRLSRVSCKNCDASPHGQFSEAEAIAAWNRRAALPTPDRRGCGDIPVNASLEANCREPWHWDEGVPYCDTCGLFRDSVARAADRRKP